MEHQTVKQSLTRAEKITLIVVSLAILGGAFLVASYLMKNRPRMERRPPVSSAVPVETMTLQPEEQQVKVSVMGNVIPAVEISLQAQVTGRITAVHQQFIAGGMVDKGDLLVRIEPRDYELVVVSRTAAVEKAEYAYKQELGQQEIARREWELMNLTGEVSELERELALRQPQLRAAEAARDAARADLDQARLNLARTVIRAPFNAVIRNTHVNVGDLATTQSVLADLVGTDAYHLRVSIPVDQLRWIDIPDSPQEHAASCRVFIGTGDVRPGRVIRLLSDLESSGRMARLLIEVKDPLTAGNPNQPIRPLLLNEFLRVEIHGRRLDNVFAVPRPAVRDGSRLWLANDQDRLEIVEFEPVWTSEQTVYCRNLQPSSRLVVSDLAAAVAGMQLKVVTAEVEVQASEEPAASEQTAREGESE